MGFKISLDVDAVNSAIERLRSLAAVLSGAGFSGKRSNLIGFSTVSGLSQSGAAHGSVSAMNKPESTKALAAHILDTAIQVEANLDSMVGADGALSTLVNQIGFATYYGASASAVDMDLKMSQIENPTTNPFAFGRPVAGYVPSLPILHAQFQATDPARATIEAAAWESTAAKITEVVSELNGVIAALSSSAETDWVQQAISRINRIQWAGGQYAANATAMSTHTTFLSQVAGAEKISTAAAHATWLIAPPEEKLFLERAYMAAFTPRLNAGLVPTVPLFDQLLPPLDAMPGMTYQPEAIQAPTTPEFERIALPQVVRDALVNNGYRDLAYAETPTQIIEQFGHPNPQLMEAIAAGEKSTQAASVATLPSVETAGAPITGSHAGASAPSGAGVGSGGVAPGGFGGASAGAAHGQSRKAGIASGVSPVGAANATSRGLTSPARPISPGQVGTGATSARDVATSGAAVARNAAATRGPHKFAAGEGMVGGFGPNSGHTRFSSNLKDRDAQSVQRGAGRVGHDMAGSLPGALLGAGAGASAGSALGGFAKGYAATPGMTSGPVGSVPPGALSAGTPGAGAGVNPGAAAGPNAATRSTAVGAPMAGGTAGGRGNDGKKNRKIRSVTSAVEREGNIRALLGQAPAVLPDVIGDGVRAVR